MPHFCYSQGPLWFVYALREPIEPWVIRYVGVSAYHEQRFEQHMQLAKRRKSSEIAPALKRKNAWIRSLLKAGKQPDFDVLYVVSSHRLAYRIERKLQEIHAPTIFNPRPFPAGRSDDPTVLLSTIELLSEELYKCIKDLNTVRWSDETRDERWQDTINWRRENMDAIRAHAGLLPLNPVKRRKLKKQTA